MTPPHTLPAPERADPLPPFLEHCRQAVTALRAATLAAYASLALDPARPQDAARRLGLNKNLAWKLARILQNDDPLDAAPHVPGSAALALLDHALRRAGADPAALDALARAVIAFDDMVALHAGDRTTLDLLIDAAEGSQRLELARKLLFRGAAGVWGLRAHARITLQFLAPNTFNPDLLDVALVGGFVGLSRLRPVREWPLFRLVAYNDDGTPEPQDRISPIEPADSPRDEAEWLIRSHCSGALPRIHVSINHRTITYAMGDGPVGRTGEFTCFFGYIARQCVSRYRDHRNRVGELSSSVTVPSEHMLCDIYAHRDLPEAHDPVPTVYGQLRDSTTSRDEIARAALPLRPKRTRLGDSSPNSTTPLAPRLNELVRLVFDRADWNPADFSATRITLDHPPVPSTTVCAYPLPIRATR